MTCACRQPCGRHAGGLTGLEEPLIKSPGVIEQLFLATVRDFDRVDDDMVRSQKAGRVSPEQMRVWESLYVDWSSYAEDFGLWQKLWGSTWHDIQQYRERLAYWDAWLRAQGLASGPRVSKPSEGPGTFSGVVSVLRWAAVIGGIGVAAYIAAPAARKALNR